MGFDCVSFFLMYTLYVDLILLHFFLFSSLLFVEFVQKEHKGLS